jgi:SecD/SecF fusion protein
MLYFPRWQTILILLVVLAGVWFTSPNFFAKPTIDALPGFLPHRQLALGLDLRGGSHLLMEVDVASLVRERQENLLDEVRTKLRAERVGYTGLVVDGEVIRLRIVDPAQMDKALSVIRKLVTPVGGLLGGGQAPIVVAADAQNIALKMTEQARTETARKAVEQSIEIIRRRIDELGTAEPSIQQQGNDRIIVQLPGVSDPQHVIDIIGKTAKMTFHLVDSSVPVAQALQGRIPPGAQVVYSNDAPPVPYLLRKRSVVSGENLIDSQARIDSRTGEYVVTFSFDSQGARAFGEVTRQNVGKPFAIVLDNKVITAPVIRTPILDGSGQIEGGGVGFTAEAANDLAILLRAGALPAPLTVIERRTVGAELGADSIRAGIMAALIGSVAVVVFMFIAYGLFGLFANLALMANIFIILGVISLLGATLTLPGIAGIVLTVGMAVDSNVLIYERIKEELRLGKSIVNAMQTGFTRAFGTIVDANLTTLIASLILFQLGAGPIRGFAVTHAIGTITTIFTAYTLTRLMMATWLRVVRPKRLPIDPRPREDGTRPWFRIIPEGFKFPFVKYRKVGLFVSGVGALASIILVATMGLNFSIDFRGGMLIEIMTEGPAHLSKIRSIGDGLGLGTVQVQEFGAPNDVLIRLESQPGGDAAQQAALGKVQSALTAGLDQKMSIVRTEVVGPTVGGELVRAGTIAILIGVALMMVYVWFRFEWQFGLGAVVSLFQGIFLTIGVFALFQIDFNVSIIAAILTIVGYSMNEVVVIYDRIRENLRKYKKMDLKELIDLSLNETLSRTTITAITTLLALLSLYVFGGEVIRNFTFAMIWGVLVGTYSSWFIAAPFLLYTGLKREWGDIKASPAAARAR